MRITKAVTLLLLAASTAALPQIAQAQQTATAVAPNDAMSTRTFALHNISKERMLEWLEAGTIPLPADLAELNAVEAGNALTARGTSDSLNQLGNVIGQLDQPLQLIQCSVQAFLLQPGEAKRIMKLDAPNDGTVPTAESLALRKQQQMSDLMSSPGVYIMSGAGTWISGVSAIVCLAKTPKSPVIGLLIGAKLEKDDSLTLSMSVPFPSAGGSFSTMTSGNVNGRSGGLTTIGSGLFGKFAEMTERDGAPHNPDIVIIAPPETD